MGSRSYEFTISVRAISNDGMTADIFYFKEEFFKKGYQVELLEK